MKDEAYVKEILQKFGETIDCYSEELKVKKYKRAYGVLTDYNKNDPGFKSAVLQMQNIHSCFESDEVSKMSAGCNSDYPVKNIHPRNVPSSDNKPPTLLDLGIIGGLDKDSRPIRSAAEILRAENRAKELKPRLQTVPREKRVLLYEGYDKDSNVYSDTKTMDDINEIN